MLHGLGGPRRCVVVAQTRLPGFVPADASVSGTQDPLPSRVGRRLPCIQAASGLTVAPASPHPPSQGTRLQNDGEALRAGRSRGRPGPPLPCAHPRRHPHPRFRHGRAAAPPLGAFGGAFRLSALSLEKDFQRILSGHGTVQLTLIQNDAECQLWLNKEEMINKRTLKKYT